MCVKTKTKFGCGHSFKSLEPCPSAPSSSAPCSEIDRYFYIGEGDCNGCRAGGEEVTRGREGQGLYAQEIERRQRNQQRAPLSEVSGNQSRHQPVDDEPKPIVTPDPWAPITRREKEWQSPHRRSADEAWVREHESVQREMALLSNSHSRSSPKSSSSKPLHSRRAAAADYEQRDELDERDRRGRGDMSSRLQSEIRRIDTARGKARGRGVRSGSYESIESVPRSAGSSRRGRTGYATGFSQAVEVVGGHIIETRSPRPRAYDYVSEYSVPRLPVGYTSRRR